MVQRLRPLTVPPPPGCTISRKQTQVYILPHIGRNAYLASSPERTLKPLSATILISHAILAAVILPLVVITLTLALRGRIERHRKLARWTLPLWFYVSVTGVVIYWMLYQISY